MSLILKNIVEQEIQKFLSEITHGDIEVIKGWGGDSNMLKIGDENQRGDIVEWDDIPNKLYHVTIFKNDILNTGYLKAQRMGKGFGGGRIPGISVTPDIDIAEQYYWGMLFAIKLANADTVEEVLSISESWFSIQERRIGKDLSELKEKFKNIFIDYYNFRKDDNIVSTADEARRQTLISVDQKIKDPYIVGGIEKLTGFSEEDIAIFIIHKDNIPKDVPVITGTDRSYGKEMTELRILGDVKYSKYYSQLNNENTINEEFLDEDYPESFNMEYFKSLTSIRKRIEYCNEHLQRLKSGSSRIVYKIDDEKVLKLARNQKGFIQNSEEVRMSQDYYVNEIMADVFDYHPDYHWIEMELARPVTPEIFKQIVGLDFDTYVSFIQRFHYDVRSRSYSNTLRDEFSQEFIDDIYNNYDFVVTVLDYIGGYHDTFLGDLTKLDSYGVVKRNGEDKIVIIDYGLTDDLFKQHYLKQR